jgi:carboxymethylenebutenolidase
VPIVLIGLVLLLQTLQVSAITPEISSFQNGSLTLHGVLYKPEGAGPFPAVLYNHGSAPGMLNNQAFEQLGPLFASRGWVFFAPYRRGQGLSATAGPFIGDEIAAARRNGMWVALVVAIPLLLIVFAVIRKQRRSLRIGLGLACVLVAVFLIQRTATRAGAAVMTRLLESGQLSDQLAGLEWLKGQSFVDRDRIAVAGNSFGGVETVLGAERVSYCAAVDASGGAESWDAAPQLRAVMVRAVRAAKAPIFLFQAENDFDLRPSRILSAEMKTAGKDFELKIYPRFGTSSSDGHSFAWAGSAIWADDVFRFLDAHCAKL